MASPGRPSRSPSHASRGAPNSRRRSAHNVIELRSYFDLPTWGPVEEKPPPRFHYGAHALLLVIERLDGPEERRQPWALRYPLRAHHRVVVRGKCVQEPAGDEYQF